MKDITRIHIAKVPYNIELTAKKNLEKYINALELYTGDHEVLEDVEIRITELLRERGVKQESVISDDDITAIRTQLGEPKDFVSDDGIEDIDVDALSETNPRKLYRNLDNAILGGVLSGTASYLRINAWWVRLAFVILGFISFGLIVLLYVVLWLIVPPAKTAAEKLQMAGRPVTLSSIRELSEAGTSVDVERRARILKRIATTTIGVGGIAAALASAATVVVVFLGLLRNGNDIGFGPTEPFQFSIVLAFIAGILLAIFFLLVAFAAFAQKFNKRIWISGVIIIVLGLGSFGAALITGAYQAQLQQQEIQRNTIDTSIKLPETIKDVKSLTVDVPDSVSVVYVVEDKDLSISMRAQRGTLPASITVEGSEMKIKMAEQKIKYPYAGVTLTIYGPRLDKIVMSNGYASYNSGTQAKFNAEVYNRSSLRLVGSRFDELMVRTDGAGQLSADEAAATSVMASLYGQSSVSLGNIKSLNVMNPDVCAANQVARLSVQNIVSKTFMHNGLEASIKSMESPCLNIDFAVDSASYSYID